MATDTVNAKLRPPLRREADLYYARLAANAQRGGGRAGGEMDRRESRADRRASECSRTRDPLTPVPGRAG